jgi:hypothetical protein
MGRACFEAEFGHYAGWVVDAIQRLESCDPVSAACQGTGNPFLLDHLAAGLVIEKGSLVLDVGVGLGGPGAWLVRERWCIRDEHGGDRRLSAAEQERNNFNRLRQYGSIEEWEFLAEKSR